MTLTIIYLNPCRRERLRLALSHVLRHLGPVKAASTVEALTQAYQPARSLRTNYNFALYALCHVVGIEGLAAISLVKEAWNPGSLIPNGMHTAHGADITHPSTNTTQ